MNNNIIVIIALALSLFLAGAATASEGIDYKQDFKVFRIVGSSQSVGQKDSLNVNGSSNSEKIKTKQLNEDLNKNIVSLKVQDNGKDWAAFKDVDQGKTSSERFAQGLSKGNNGVRIAETNSMVAPEPMAMVLYGLGGLPVVAHLLRRRKQSVV